MGGVLTDGTSKGERTKERILDAAEKLFARDGFKATTLREVARQCRINVQGIYFYFDSKRQLYEATMERALLPIKAALDEALAKRPGEETINLTGLMIDIFSEKPHIVFFLHHAITSDDGVSARIANRWLNIFLVQGLKILKQNPNITQKRRLAIELLALYNITTGYFLSEKIFSAYQLGSIMDKRNLGVLKALLDDMSSYLFQPKT